MTSSVIRLICPNLRCRTILAVPGSSRGRMVRCRNCSARVQVPGSATGAGGEADSTGRAADPPKAAGRSG